MRVLTYKLGPPTNAYLLLDDKTLDAVLIDAPPGAWGSTQPYLREKPFIIDDAVTDETLANPPIELWGMVQAKVEKPYRLKALLLTHGHWDHVFDAYMFSKGGVKVYAHEADSGLIENPGSEFLPTGFYYEAPEVHKWIEDGEVLEFLGERFEVRHVPGHSPGSVVFYLPDQGIAFTGDPLFAHGIGAHSIPQSDYELLKQSIKEKIYTLPDETVVYPGHGPLTTVGHEKVRNPFVRT